MGPISDIVHALEEWLVAWADSAFGPVVLAVLTAAESVIFPIPTDPLLIALALRAPENAIWLAGLTTAFSVAGGLVGHWLGLRFGHPMLHRFKADHVTRVERMFQRYGFWAIVFAGLTPLPFKIFTIAAGVFAVPRMPFILGSIVGRGLRFFAIGILIFLWGDRFMVFLDERFELVMTALGLLLVVAAVVLAVWYRRTNGRRPASPATLEPAGEPVNERSEVRRP